MVTTPQEISRATAHGPQSAEPAFPCLFTPSKGEGKGVFLHGGNGPGVPGNTSGPSAMPSTWYLYQAVLRGDLTRPAGWCRGFRAAGGSRSSRGIPPGFCGRLFLDPAPPKRSSSWARAVSRAARRRRSRLFRDATPETAPSDGDLRRKLGGRRQRARRGFRPMPDGAPYVLRRRTAGPARPARTCQWSGVRCSDPNGDGCGPSMLRPAVALACGPVL